MHQLTSLYVHFPHCRHLCNYCDFFKSVPKTLGDYSEFEQYLDKALGLHQSFLTEAGYRPGELETLYMGGGTPSLWGPQGVGHFLERLNAQGFKLFASDFEWTMEINPGSFKEADLAQYQDLGLNRVSLGTQSTDPRFIKLLDRIHSREEAFAALEKMALRFPNFSVDLMLGLPHSHTMKRDILRELEELLSFGPKHLSLYILTVKGNYIHRHDLPSDEYIEEEYLRVSEYLRTRGFRHYEVSNFALPGYESKHNLRYWEQATVGAIGPSATGYLSERKLRYKWPGMNLKLDREELTVEEVKLERLYLSLRTNRGVTPAQLGLGPKSERFVAAMIERGWLAWSEGELLVATPKGYLMMDSLLDEIFKLSI